MTQRQPETAPLPLTAGVRRLLNLDKFAIAFELEQACDLEAAANVGGEPGAWKSVSARELVGHYFQTLRAVRGPGYVALQVLNTSGDRLWLRNRPDGHGSAVNRWNCAVSIDDLRRHEPRLGARYVQLDQERCESLSPLFGAASDITTSIYTVVGATLFSGGAPGTTEADEGVVPAATIGVRLEAEGGERRLTVTASEFDTCFAGATRTPPKPAEVAALRSWLSGESAGEPAASVSFQAFAAAAGIDKGQCVAETQSRRTWLSCHAPVTVVEATSKKGAFGTPRLSFVRERLAGGAYFIDDVLASPLKAARVFVAVRAPQVEKAGTFSRTLASELGRTIGDDAAQLQRATTGRFLLVGDLAAQRATHTLDVTVNYQIPPVEVTTEPRSHSYIAGKKSVPNPEYPKAQGDLAVARDALALAEREATAIRQRIAALRRVCAEGSEAAARATDQVLGGGLLGLAGKAVVGGAGNASCSEAALAAERTVVDKRLSAARTELDTAKARADATPTTQSIDDQRAYQYSAKHHRRSGSANAELVVRRAGSETPLFRHGIQVPFEALSVEIPSVPEVGLVGQPATTPSDDDVERELAKALTPLIDRTILKWGVQRDVGGDVGDVRPGTRSWMVMVARHAAAGRPVKLISDLFDNRPGSFASASTVYPLSIPSGTVDRCWVIGAISRDGQSKLNLALERSDGDVLARDRRDAADGAFEVCRLSPGNYRVRLWYDPQQKPSAVLVALFDSTPGRVAPSDVGASTRGLPTISRRGAELKLDGKGTVVFEGTGGVRVTGATGDHDGDGVPDEIDHCPYEREEVNGYLDHDGCPDQSPPGWVAPKRPAPSLDAEAQPKQATPDERAAEKKVRRTRASSSKKPKKTEIFIP